MGPDERKEDDTWQSPQTPSATASTPSSSSRRSTRSRRIPRWRSSSSGRATAGSTVAQPHDDPRLLRSESGGHLPRRRVRVDAGEPSILIGSDTGPNPAEYLLHALAACLTTSLVYVAAARGVHLTEVESTVEGDMDVQGALGLSDDYRNGFEQIRVTFSVKGDAPEEKLQGLVARAQQRSAVFDMVTNGVPVTVEAVTG